MTYFVTQYGNLFFVIRRIKGYTGNIIHKGTQISSADYKKLWYSTSEREIIKTITNRFDEVRIKGVASEILGREI